MLIRSSLRGGVAEVDDVIIVKRGLSDSREASSRSVHALNLL